MKTRPLLAATLLAAFAAQAEPLAVRQDGFFPVHPRDCATGTAWTCTVICDPGTRTPIERSLNQAGAEVCAVSDCACRPLPLTTGRAREVRPSTSAIDTGLPLAVVVFGVTQLLDGPGRP